MNATHGITTSTEDRALELLGAGLSPSLVASAVGVSESRISQLLSSSEFSARVAELRFSHLQKHNVRDSEYDTLEDALLEKLKDLIPFMMRPMEVLRAIQIINGAKRRGLSTPETVIQQQNIVNINIPVSIISKFTMNAQNQIIQTGTENGTQDLVTMQSGVLLKMVQEKEKAKDPLLLAGEKTNDANSSELAAQISEIKRRREEREQSRTSAE